MFTPNLLFGLSIITFFIISYLIYLKYTPYDRSISDTIHLKDIHTPVLIGFILLSAFILCYEYNRNCMFSLCCIGMFLIGLYGVIMIPVFNYRDHYSYAILIILGMLLFMKKNCMNTILAVSLFIELLVLSNILKHAIERNRRIFSCEILLIFNFIFFYTYLHCLKYL
jgi:hypothetical protein